MRISLQKNGGVQQLKETFQEENRSRGGMLRHRLAVRRLQLKEALKQNVESVQPGYSNGFCLDPLTAARVSQQQEEEEGVEDVAEQMFSSEEMKENGLEDK